MAIQITIGGVDYTQYVDLKSIRVESNIAVGSDTCDLDILIPTKSIGRPKGGQEIKIINGSNIEFGGVVLQPKEIALASDQMLYQTKCRDYVFWLDKHVVPKIYTQSPAGIIVKDIVANYTNGFSTNNVQGVDQSFLIQQMAFDHVPPSKAIKKLADAVGYQWWVDYTKDIHFKSTMSVVSPLPNNSLNADTDIVNYSNLQIEEDVSQVRNQVYLMGYKVPATYSITQNFQCDGQNNTFYTAYEPKHKLKTITVKLGGVTQKNALDIVGGTPNSQLQDGTVYISYKEGRLRFNVAPAAGQVLSITYNPMFEIISMYNDPNAITSMSARDGQDGVYEFSIRDQQLTSIDTTLAATRGLLELTKYANPHITGQFDSFTQGWMSGQWFSFTSNNRMGGDLQNQVLYVTKVDKTVVNHPVNGTPTFQYTVYFSDTPFAY